MMTANLNQNATTLKDPRRCVVDFDLLQAAYEAIPRRILAQLQWQTKPIPEPPVGYVRREWAYQLATFLVPIGLLLAFWHFWGEGRFWGVPTFLLWGLPVALRVGQLLDKSYMKQLKQARLVARLEDGGRYRAVQLIASRTLLRPEEITLPVIQKMAQDYRVEQDKRDKAKAQQKPAAASAYRAGAGLGTVAPASAAAAVAAAATSADYDSETSSDNDIWNSPSVDEIFGTVNPASGLPMIPGSSVDVAGQVYGTTIDLF